jgi:tripartite-type tricarboxylate transporter receptor subunit TctC
MKVFRIAGPIAVAMLLGAVAFTALAQSYPTKPIRVVIPWPIGGITDVITRAVALHLSDAFGQQVIVDNRPGAGGTLGAGLVAKAPPDGYTLLMHDVASHSISANLYSKLPYDILKDFEPITLVAGSPMLLVVNPGLNIRTVPELIALAKTKPGQLNYASSGIGAINHLAVERLQRMVGIELAHIPFKGSIQAATSVIAGDTAISFSTIPAAVPQAKAGKLVLIATSFAKRTAQFGDVPTVAETVGEFDHGFYSALWAPAGTPREIVERLHTEIAKAVEQPKVKEILSLNGAEPGRMTPPQFGQYVANEVRTWGEVIRAAGIKAE